MAGGSADLSNNIYKGDRILTVNDVSIEEATHEAAADQLKRAGDSVHLTVQQQVIRHHFRNYSGHNYGFSLLIFQNSRRELRSSAMI